MVNTSQHRVTFERLEDKSLVLLFITLPVLSEKKVIKNSKKINPCAKKNGSSDIMITLVYMRFALGNKKN